MKTNKRLGWGALALLATLLVSCGGSDESAVIPPQPSEAASAIITCEEGASTEIAFTAASSWVVSNGNTWFGVTPASGQAGDNILTVSAAQSYSGIHERVASFTVIDGSEKRVFYVVQRGIVTTVVAEENIYAMAGTKELAVAVSGTYPFEDVKVTTSADWLRFSGINTVAEPILLPDQTTYSAFRKGEIELLIVEDNCESATRCAEVTVTAGEQTLTFTVHQQSTQGATADFTKEFYKSSVIMKFTGTWCSACPNMSEAIHLAQAEMPGRLHTVNIHINSSNNLDWAGSSKLFNHFDVVGLPAGFFNGYAEIYNDYHTIAKGALVDLIHEAVEKYPTDVAIYAASRVENGKINLSVDMASKTSGDYRLTVLFLENGIQAEQADGYGLIDNPKTYVHNNILRGTATEGYANGGDRVTLSQNEITRKEFSVDIPSNIVDIDNTDILIYVTHDGSATIQSVSNSCFMYKDFGWVVDNAVLLPMNSFVDFRYE